MDYHGLPGGLYINITAKYQMVWCCEIRGARVKRCITSPPPPPFAVQVTFILSQNEWDDSLIPHFRVQRSHVSVPASKKMGHDLVLREHHIDHHDHGSNHVGS
jgi:hypothetical protein